MVALAWAMAAGCIRPPAATAPAPSSPVVRAPSAPSTLQRKLACPCLLSHGWKWSVPTVPVKPCCSAYSA